MSGKRDGCGPHLMHDQVCDLAMAEAVETFARRGLRQTPRPFEDFCCAGDQAPRPRCLAGRPAALQGGSASIKTEFVQLSNECASRIHDVRFSSSTRRGREPPEGLRVRSRDPWLGHPPGRPDPQRFGPEGREPRGRAGAQGRHRHAGAVPSPHRLRSCRPRRFEGRLRGAQPLLRCRAAALVRSPADPHAEPRPKRRPWWSRSPTAAIGAQVRRHSIATGTT